MVNPRTRRLLPVLLLIAPALAAAGGEAWYRQSDVVQGSTRFAESARASQAAVTPVEDQLKTADQALAQMDRASALLRGSVPTTWVDMARARLDERATRFEGEHETIQKKLTDLEIGFESAYSAALERGKDQVRAGGFATVKECASGGAMEALSMGGPGGGAAPPACPGTDVSTRIAAAWDQDAELARALTALQTGAWPVVTTYAEAMEAAVLGGRTRSAGWFDPARVAESLPEANEALDTADRLAQKSRSALSAARRKLGENLDKEVLEAIRSRARGVRAFLEDAEAHTGKALLSGVERAVKKEGAKAGWGEIGACVNPVVWGGCEGPDRTKEVTAALLADKKLARELAKIRDGLVQPPSSVE